VESYKSAKEDSTSLRNSDKFLSCLELLINILEQQGGPERLAKAEKLRKEIEESKVSVEAMYVAALEEARREGEKRREGKARKKKSNKKRRGKRIRKKQSMQGGGNEEGRPASDEAGTGEGKGTHLSLESLTLEEEEEEEQHKEEKEEEEEVCAVCLCSMDDEEDDHADMVSRLQCSYEFHGGCVGDWVTTCNRKGLPLTCPTCRGPFLYE
jgi:rubrerythrin